MGQNVGIKYVSQKYNLSIYAIRYYEKIGLYKVPRSKNGIRNFDEVTLTKINAVVHYRKAGLSIKQIQYIFSNPNQHKEHIQTFLETKDMLLEQLKSLEKTINFLNDKINYHQEKLKKQRK